MLQTLKQLSQLKSSIIELADVLLTEDIERTKKEIAYDLLLSVDSLNRIEERVQGEMESKVMRPLFNKCEEIELERENKNDQLAGNEWPLQQINN